MADPSRSVAGSNRQAPAFDEYLGKVDGGEPARIVVRLRRRHSLPDLSDFVTKDPRHRTYLKRAQIDRDFGADPAAIEALDRFARSMGIVVEPTRYAGGTLAILTGVTQQFQSAFGVSLDKYRRGDRQFLARTGTILCPPDLYPYVRGVFGLDTRSQVIGRHSFVPGPPTVANSVIDKVIERYEFPGSTGKGQKIAILEFGGQVSCSDFELYFSARNQPRPRSVKAVPHFGFTNSLTSEVADSAAPTMDACIASTVAPDAEITVHFAPETTAGWIYSVARVLDETDPDVLSISWGEAESNLTKQFINAFYDICYLAAQRGTTVVCSSGNEGSAVSGLKGNQVYFPASCPLVLSCGGSEEVSIRDARFEVVWNEGPGFISGGGQSRYFHLPDWQERLDLRKIDGKMIPLSRRAVPDVAGQATGYVIFHNGLDHECGGTSAVAPLWAGLIACINETTGRRSGFLNAVIYEHQKKLATHRQPSLFTDIFRGNNGTYFATDGWDACTGWGTPNGKALLQRLI